MSAPSITRLQKTYGKIIRDGKNWILEDIEPHVAIRLKKIFLEIPKYQTAPFTFVSTPENDMELDWFMKRYPLEISKSDEKILSKGVKEFHNNIFELDEILLPEFEPKVKGMACFPYLDKKPRKYQWQMAELVTKKKVSMCGDLMGLGKTITGIATISLNIDKGHSVVVCPTHLVRHWRDKIEEFTNLKVHIIKKGTAYDLPKADVYIFKYTVMKGWVDVFKKRIFHTVVFDEVQELRRGKESIKGMVSIELCKNTEVKLGMSGTPVYNYGDEIFNILNTLEEGIIGTDMEFDREWCSPMGNGKSKVNDPEALGRYLREQHLLIRRTKKDIGLEISKVSSIIETVEHDNTSVKNFEEIAKKLAITASTGSFVERGQASRDLDMLARQTTGIAKAKSVAEMARMFIESGEPVLLSGWHREVYRIWAGHLSDLSPLMYTGSESEAQKHRNKEAFINGESNLMIISNRSGAGLDGLQHRCSTLIIGELDWTPKVHEQLVFRLDREGQKNPIMVLYPVINDGSDPAIMELCGLKASQSDGIVNLYESDDVDYGADKSRIKKLVDYYLNKK